MFRFNVLKNQAKFMKRTFHKPIMKNIFKNSFNLNRRYNTTDDTLSLLERQIKENRIKYYPRKNSPPRGKDVDLGNGKYENGISSLYPSTHIDADLYEEVWEKLGYEVTKFKDLRGNEILDAVRQMTDNVHERDDGIIFCYSGHGSRMDVNTTMRGRDRDDALCGIDGKMVSIYHSTQSFNNENLSQMINKPKLFFFDCCRGNIMEKFHEEYENNKSISKNSRRIPTSADILIARASRDFHVSYSPGLNEPGVYTKKLHEIMTGPKNNGNLGDCLLKVADEMKKDGCYESSNFTSYLTRHVDSTPIKDLSQPEKQLPLQQILQILQPHIQPEKPHQKDYVPSL